MTDISALKDKLRKIEALFAGAATSGEKAAAGAAAERIRAQLVERAAREATIEMKFSLPDPWSRRLFHRALSALWPQALPLRPDAAADDHCASASLIP